MSEQKHGIEKKATASLSSSICQAPDAKCERHRYKQLLREAVASAGVTPQLGGLEYAEDLVRIMDMDKVAKSDASFGKSVAGIRRFLMKWSAEER